MFSDGELNSMFGGMIIGLILIGVLVGVILTGFAIGLWQLMHHLQFIWM